MKNLSGNWKLTIRSLIKQKKATSLNILGLSLAFVAVLFISVYVHREFSFDNFHQNRDRIFKPEFGIAEADADIDMASNLSLTQIELFRDNVPGLETITFLNYSRWDWDNGTWVEYDGNKFNLERLAFSDPNFAKVFSFPVESGDLASSLDDPNSLVLTKDISDKLFKDEYPIGKKVLLNNKPVVVGAVLEKVPHNSSLQISGLVSYRSAKYFFGSDIGDFSNIPFLQIGKNADQLDISSTMSEILRNSLPAEEIERLNPVFTTKLIALEDLYFYDESPYDPIKHGSMTFTYMLLGIGILILLLALINYTNLLLATSLKWKKNFGIQQVLGANRNTERSQLFLKGFVVSIVAFLLSIVILRTILTGLNQLINYPLNKEVFLTKESILIVLLVLTLTIVFSGFFPSVFNIKSTPLTQLRGVFVTGNQRGGIWKSLVTFQLFVSIALIICSLVIYKQIRYGLTKDLGIQMENMITVPSIKLGGKKNAFIDAVSDHVQTESQCLSSTYINTFDIWGGKLKEPGKNDKSIDYNIVRVNNEFLNTLKLELVGGRDFGKDGVSDERSMIVNQAFVDYYELTNPLEASIRGLPIIGVVENFNFNSVHYQIEPLVLSNTPKQADLSTIRFSANTREELGAYMDFLRNEWMKLAPEKPFEFEFLDKRLASMYKKEIVLSKVLISFAVLSIFIACLGILGLLSYIMESRIKEIGIRKVNGAGILEILRLINMGLVNWTLIGFVIACPIAWFAMNKWLENFAYKTTLSWWIFLLAGVLALGIALLTVSWQSWRAATRNPVEALRYE